MVPYACYSNYFSTVPFLSLFPASTGSPIKNPFPIFQTNPFFPRGRQTIKELQSETSFHTDMLTIFYQHGFSKLCGRPRYVFFLTTHAKCVLCSFSYHSLEYFYWNPQDENLILRLRNFLFCFYRYFFFFLGYNRRRGAVSIHEFFARDAQVWREWTRFVIGRVVRRDPITTTSTLHVPGTSITTVIPLRPLDEITDTRPTRVCCFAF